VKFLYAKLRGTRFNGHSIPTPLLQDLYWYSKLIEEFAVYLYRSENPGRRNLPKGFRDSFKLNLTDLKDGSAITEFTREEVQVSMPATAAGTDYFEYARDRFNEIIQAAQPQLPKELIPIVEKFGKNLLDTEQLDLSNDESFSNVYTYNRAKRLTLLSNWQPPTSGCALLLCMIDWVSISSQDTKIILDSGKEIEALHPSFLKEKLREIHKESEKYQLKVIGKAKFSADNELLSLQEIQHIIIFNEGQLEVYPSFENRLNEFRALQTGWFDGEEGEPFEKDAIDILRRLLNKLLTPGNIPAPYLYAHPENEITLEWTLGNVEVVATYFCADQRFDMFSFNKDTDAREDVSFNLDTEGDNDTAASLIEEFIGKFITGESE